MPPELPPRRPSASLPDPVREAATRAGRRRRPIDPRVLQRVRDALRAISGWLREQEETALRDELRHRRYLIIRPVNLASPPAPERVAEITAAVRTLDHHGFIIT